MKRHIPLIACGLIAALSCRPLAAVQEYYGFTRSVRALGMGGAFYALSDDEYAMFYNPASLDMYRGRPRVTLTNFGLMSSTSAVTDLASVINSATGHQSLYNAAQGVAGDQNAPISAAGGFFPYFLKKKFAFGLLIADSKINAAPYGPGPISVYDVTVLTDTGLFLAWSTKASKHWHLGINAKAVYRAAGHNVYSETDLLSTKQNFTLSTFQRGGTGFAIDGDVGAIYQIDDPWIGDEAGLSFVLSNGLGTYLVSSGNEPPELPRTFSSGVYTTFEARKWVESFTFRLDAADFALGGYQYDDFGARGGKIYKHFNAGVEVKVSPTIAVRGGLRQGNWTAGLGFALPGIHLDLATYGEELLGVPGALTSRRFALQLSFGFELQGSHAVFFNPD